MHNNSHVLSCIKIWKFLQKDLTPTINKSAWTVKIIHFLKRITTGFLITFIYRSQAYPNLFCTRLNNWDSRIHKLQSPLIGNFFYWSNFIVYKMRYGLAPKERSGNFGSQKASNLSLNKLVCDYFIGRKRNGNSEIKPLALGLWVSSIFWWQQGVRSLNFPFSAVRDVTNEKIFESILICPFFGFFDRNFWPTWIRFYGL